MSKENNLIDVNKLNLLMELVAKINSNLELKNILKENLPKDINCDQVSSKSTILIHNILKRTKKSVLMIS